jgi:hypothetical protein
MALTDQQMIDTRRHMGYQVIGDYPVADENDIVFASFGMVTMSLHRRLTTLQPGEESILINTYLANLATLEEQIFGTADNLDTDQAAVWHHNKHEQSDRDRLFDSSRRRMCAFLGFPPGPGLGLGGYGMRVVRA